VISTGSGLEREINCRAATVLPRNWSDSSTDAARGTELHNHLERVNLGTPPTESLDMVDPKHRGACEAVDLDALKGDLALSPEVTLVYNPFTDTARVLGQSLERDYSGVTEDEVPMTLDLVGVNLQAGVGAVRDFKSGWGKLTPALRNWQILGGSLALARVYDLDTVDGQLIHLRDGVSIRRDSASFTAADFAVAAGELRIFADRKAADRARFAAGEYIEPTEGSWCKYCPSAWTCPAKTGLIRAAISPDGIPESRVTPLTPETAVQAWHAINRAMPMLQQLKTAIMALASGRPLLLEVQEDGTEVWLGEDEVLGNEKLDGKISVAAAAEILLGDDPEKLAAGLAALQAEIADLKVTKKKLTDAVKDRVARGTATKTAERIFKLVRDRGGATRETKREVRVFTRKPGRAA
jgi:hypothetical protein